MTWPALTVSAAFGIAPLTVPSAGQWVDISAYVRRLDWRRGRNHELARSSPGEVTIALDNTDRRFDPDHAGGPYYPNVQPMTRIRVRAVHSAVTYDLFTGYVEEWTQQWLPRPIQSAGDAEVTVRAVDAFKLLALFGLTGYSTEVLADAPSAYWPLDEGSAAGGARNLGSAGDADGTYVGDVAFGISGHPLAGGRTAVEFAAGSGAVEVPFTADLDLRDDITFEWWSRVPSTYNPATDNLEVIRLTEDDQVPWRWSVACGAGSGSARWEVIGQDPGGVFRNFALDGATFSTNVWEHWVIVREGSEIRAYRDGALVDTLGIPNARAGAGNGSPYWTIGGGASAVNDESLRLSRVALYDHVLSPERIAAHADAPFDTFVDQLSGAHIGAVLDVMGWPAGERILDAGASVIQSTEPSGSALEWLLRIAEDTENGLLHMSGDGKVRFHDRANLQALAHVTPAASFGDSVAEDVVYEDVAFRRDDADLYSTVEVPREGGPGGRATDAAAAAAYGPRTLQRPASLASSDEDTIDVANHLLALYKSPATRPERLDLNPFDVDARWTQALARDIHADPVTVKRRPPGGGSVSTQEARIEGVAHSVTPPRAWAVQWDLVPAPPVAWLLANATYGVLGSTTRLGY